MSGAPIINGTNTFPLEMEHNLTAKPPQRTVRAPRNAYGSPKIIKSTVVCHFLMNNCINFRYNFYGLFHNDTMNVAIPY